MQNLNISSKHFDRIKTNTFNWVDSYMEGIDEINKVITDENSYKLTYTHLQWTPPYQENLRNNYYNILYALANYSGVKLMWRKIVEAGNFEIKKTILVIGYKLRIDIFNLLANSYFKGYFEFSNWFKTDLRKRTTVSNVKGINNAINKVNEANEERVCLYLKKNTIYNIYRRIMLEKYIIERYNLDFKNYHVDHKEYNHAISKKFHHKRMML